MVWICCNILPLIKRFLYHYSSPIGFSALGVLANLRQNEGQSLPWYIISKSPLPPCHGLLSLKEETSFDNLQGRREQSSLALLWEFSSTVKLEAMMYVDPRLRHHHASDGGNEPVERHIHIAIFEISSLYPVSAVVGYSVYFLERKLIEAVETVKGFWLRP